jgi:nucleoside 2-deoxyribosyltransferase
VAAVAKIAQLSRSPWTVCECTSARVQPDGVASPVVSSGTYESRPTTNHWGVLIGIVAAADGVLAYLASTTSDPELQLALIVGCFLVLFGCLGTLLVGLRRDKAALIGREQDSGASSSAIVKEEIKYDLFISTPMDGLDEKAYEQHRQRICELIEELQAAKILRIACRLKDAESKAFGASDVALERNLRSIRQSRAVVLVLPNRRATSALVETGAALAMGKQVFAFAANKLDNLPFLIRQSTKQDKGHASHAINLKTYNYGEFRDISRHLIDNKHLIFGQPALPPSY